MQSLVRRAACAAACVSLLSACASSTGAGTGAPSLDGTSWILAELPDRTVLKQPLVTLRFSADQLSGTDGCNRFSAPYVLSRGRLEVASGLAATQMACAPEIDAQARAFIAALSSTRAYAISNDRLVLRDAASVTLAILRPQPRDLVGSTWRATGVNNGKGGVVSILAGSDVTLSFDAEGRATGSAGCNRYTAAYTASDTSVAFGPAAATRRMCAEPGRMEQEARFLQALTTVTTARVEGDRLELRTAAGAIAASFVRADGG
jgi:heat shock protein HslJ